MDKKPAAKKSGSKRKSVPVGKLVSERKKTNNKVVEKEEIFDVMNGGDLDKISKKGESIA